MDRDRRGLLEQHAVARQRRYFFTGRDNAGQVPPGALASGYVWYSLPMTGVLHPIPETTDHDTSLVECFLSLTPAQRLAELDSRVSFLR